MAERAEPHRAQFPIQDELQDAEPETPHGRIGYGRYGKYTPLALAVLMILGLGVIGWLQWRSGPDAAPPSGRLSGSPAPEVTLTLLDGTKLELADLRGAVVVLNFWASWCEPCRAEMPMLQAVHEDARAAGEATVVVGVGIRTDHDDDARAFVRQLGLTYPIGRDTDIEGPGIGPIERAFGIQGVYPSTVIIRPDGIVDRLLLGELTESQLQFAIDEARDNSDPGTSGSD